MQPNEAAFLLVLFKERWETTCPPTSRDNKAYQNLADFLFGDTKQYQQSIRRLSNTSFLHYRTGGFGCSPAYWLNLDRIALYQDEVQSHAGELFAQAVIAFEQRK